CKTHRSFRWSRGFHPGFEYRTCRSCFSRRFGRGLFGRLGSTLCSRFGGCLLLLVGLPFRFLCRDLCFRHFSEGIVMIADVVAAEIKDTRHGQAFRRTNGRTKSAAAGFANVYLKGRGVKTLGCSVWRLADLRYRPYGLHGVTIHGAALGALVPNDAVVYFIMEPVPSVVGNRKYFT